MALTVPALVRTVPDLLTSVAFASVRVVPAAVVIELSETVALTMEAVPDWMFSAASLTVMFWKVRLASAPVRLML